ncbi:hypothetical protein [Anaeromicropila herbilytica]|uniref:SAF domain-containing protein n=1 Tax=Anaeromicropila herbilytica TaxID=2785025 RepID=A0A7R7IF55_9FIRM|nr:hypothetical protein [Anaeromicropila herbilytica]BCN32824.1 hypothetical protein bsdtb5_41190 [Anaeromicropila herbilytica]
MSIIRQRKKHLIKASLLGGIVVLIPFVVLVIYLLLLLQSSNHKLQMHQRKENERSICYSLRKDMDANQIITRTDIKEVSVLLPDKSKKCITMNEILGKRAKLSLSKNTLVTDDLIYEGSILEDDLRLHNYNFIKFQDKIKIGDFIDIRISFPNGADFILLSKKKVIDFSNYNVEQKTSNSLWMEVSEEEILRLSSAVVDSYHIDGCQIYAILYVEDTQEASTVTYPTNRVVQDLMKKDPNILRKATNVLESNLRKELELERLYNKVGYNKTGDGNENGDVLESNYNDTDSQALEENKENGIEFID